MEIKSAYKQRALEYHPDKHTESEEGRRVAEEKFKVLGEALEFSIIELAHPAERLALADLAQHGRNILVLLPPERHSAPSIAPERRQREMLAAKWRRPLTKYSTPEMTVAITIRITRTSLSVS